MEENRKRVRFLDVFAVCCIVLCLVVLYGMFRPKMQTEQTELHRETTELTQPGEDTVPPETTPQETAAPTRKLSLAEEGDSVFFGTFEQDGDPDNGAEPIEWTVLAREEGRILVISKSILDWRPYHLVRVPVTWAECSLRSWLNEDFLTAAFTEEEQRRIPTVTNPLGKNPNYGTASGDPTQDRIFLLSPQELKQYSFDKWQASAYAVAEGAEEENSQWWLRAPGISQNNASRAAYHNGTTITDDHVNRRSGVRPAMWIETGEGM